MIEINLIRKRALTKNFSDKLKKIILIAGGAAFLLLAGLITFYINLSIRTSNYERELRAAETEVNQLSRRYNVDDWIAGWTELYKKVSIVEEILEQRKEYASRLAQVGRLLPEKMHIYNIKVNSAEERVLVTLLLEPADNAAERVGEYILLLEESLFFPGGVEADEAGEIEVGGKNLLQFDLVLSMIGE